MERKSNDIDMILTSIMINNDICGNDKIITRMGLRE
jgi:hypothetical protein